MLYYRIKPNYDGARTPSGNTLVKNELYTPKEFEKLGVRKDVAVEVNVSKKQVYMSFGARFQFGTDHNSNL